MLQPFVELAFRTYMNKSPWALEPPMRPTTEIIQINRILFKLKTIDSVP